MVICVTFDAEPGEESLARGGRQLQEGEQGQPGGHPALEGFPGPVRWGGFGLLGLSRATRALDYRLELHSIHYMVAHTKYGEHLHPRH